MSELNTVSQTYGQPAHGVHSGKMVSTVYSLLKEQTQLASQEMLHQKIKTISKTKNDTID
jgi:hypothetical protein